MGYSSCAQRYLLLGLSREYPLSTASQLKLAYSNSILRWGSPEFIGLGFLSFITIVLVELFGSPFLKSASIIVGLVVGCVVAGAAGYIDASSIDNAPVVTFLWCAHLPPSAASGHFQLNRFGRVHTFELKVYPPAILPMIAVYSWSSSHVMITHPKLMPSQVAVAMEAIGDITASAEVSRLKVEGPEFDSRIQGGVLADGVAGFFCALFMVTPLSVFAQVCICALFDLAEVIYLCRITVSSL